MKVTIIKKARYSVAAVGSPEGGIPCIDFLRGIPADMKAYARGMYVLFDLYSQKGKTGLTSPVFHEANKESGIWEFIKGRLRVYCFMDDGALIVLTHGSIKKTQKADKGEVARAVRLKDEYVSAKQEGTLVQCELEGGNDGKR